MKSLKLNPALLEALHKCGYTKPTPIQQEAIPRVLAGKDLIATAQTGTGKTAAFVLPLLHNLLSAPKQKLPSILILSPTRELAYQITESIHKYSNRKVKVVSILGGVPYHTQLRALEKPVDIIVATPGRLIDYIKRNSVNLTQIHTLVLDEADRMLDMGFIDDVKFIATKVAKQRQTLMFTATLDERIKKLAQTILNAPEYIAIAAQTKTLDNIKQSLYVADDKNHKDNLLAYLLTSSNFYKAIIFSATKHFADKLSKRLRDQGLSAGALHGDMPQGKRTRIINQFRGDELNVLVATDLAARGLDINDLDVVINYDLPRAAEDYVHRIGRTGRAGKEGRAISLVSFDESLLLSKIERFIGYTISQQTVEGLEPKRSLKSTASKSKKFGGHRKESSHKRFGGGNNRRSSSSNSDNPRRSFVSSHSEHPRRSAGASEHPRRSTSNKSEHSKRPSYGPKRSSSASSGVKRPSSGAHVKRSQKRDD